MITVNQLGRPDGCGAGHKVTPWNTSRAHSQKYEEDVCKDK